MELKHATKQLNDKQSQKTSSDTNYQRNKQNMETKTAAIEKLKVSVEDFLWMVTAID